MEQVLWSFSSRETESPQVSWQPGMHICLRPMSALKFAKSQSSLLALKPNGMTVAQWIRVPDHLKHQQGYTAVLALSEAETAEVLWHFARWCALQLIHVCGEMPEIVYKYLKNGNEPFRPGARAVTQNGIRKLGNAGGDESLATQAAHLCTGVEQPAILAGRVARLTARAQCWLRARPSQDEQFKRMVESCRKSGKGSAKWKQVAVDVDIVLAEVKRIGEALGGVMPTQKKFNTERRQGIPDSSTVAVIVGCKWSELAECTGLTLTHRQLIKARPAPLKIKSQDTQRFEALWHTGRKSIFAYLMNRVMNADLAEDLMMDTYTESLAALRRGSFAIDMGNPTAFLVAASKNAVKVHFNKAKAHNQQAHIETEDGVDWVEGFAPSHDPSIEDAVLEQELLTRAVAIICNDHAPELTPNEQNVMMWRLAGCDIKEIVEITGLRTATVRTYLWKAREKLRVKWPADVRLPRKEDTYNAATGLSQGDLIEVKDFAARGWSHRDIGRQMGVSATTVKAIIDGDYKVKPVRPQNDLTAMYA